MATRRCVGLTIVAVLAMTVSVCAQEPTGQEVGGEEGAYQKIEELAKKRPPRPRSRSEVAQYRAALTKMREDVVAAADQFLTAYPKSTHTAQVRYKKAYALGALGSSKRDATKTVAAKEIFGELTQSAPDAVASQAHLMLAYLTRRTDIDQAIEHATLAAEKATEESTATRALYTLAGMYERENRDEEAKATYKKLIDSYPKSRTATSARSKLKRLSLKGKELTDLKFTAVDGSQVDIADYKGKVVLIDFWATWCGPCKAEMPNVIKAYNEHKAAGFEIIGISLDKDKAKCEAYTQEQGMTWPQYFDGKGWSNLIAKRYGVNSIPATFLLDRKGVVRALSLRGSRLEEEVVKLLQEE